MLPVNEQMSAEAHFKIWVPYVRSCHRLGGRKLDDSLNICHPHQRKLWHYQRKQQQQQLRQRRQLLLYQFHRDLQKRVFLLIACT